MVQTKKSGTWIWLGKVLLAGVIAFIVLTLFCMVYDNVPIRYKNTDGATDCHWPAHKFYCRFTEGFSWGRTNNEGYNDLNDYTDDTSVDVLIMGSSHMQAFNVPKKLSTAGRLATLLPDKTVYNIGMSSHVLLNCAQNISAAVQKYTPSDYVVIETSRIFFPNDDLQKTLAFEYPRVPSYNSPLLVFLQEIHFLRRMYHQLLYYIDQLAKTEEVAVEDMNDPELLSALLSRMADAVSSSGAKLIIAYHPGTVLEKDGSITFSTTEAEEDAFAALCEENGVYFVNMRDRFQREYDENHVLPNGFTNSAVGTGHMNRYGHEMMAEELYALMQEEGL